MPDVLILGGRAPAALDHARRFAHQGWRVHVADSVSFRLSGWSRSVSHCIPLAPPRQDPAGFVAGLRHAVTTQSIDLVVPTCEEVFFLSRYRNALPSSCRVVVDEFDKLRQLHSKWDFLFIARACGGNAPASALVSSLAEAREWAGSRPLVIKPEYSRFGVHVRVYPAGIPGNAPELPRMGRWVAQHYCEGTELCSYSIADQGRLLAHTTYRPEHRLRRSASYYFRAQANDAILAFVERLVAHIGFTGQIAFDWIDSGDGNPAVIECNPRAVSGLHLFAPDDGIPAALAGTATACVHPAGRASRMLAPVMLTAGLAQALFSGSPRQWRADYSAASDVLAARGDMMPALGALADIGSFALNALRAGTSVRAASTHDIEWDGEELPGL